MSSLGGVFFLNSYTDVPPVAALPDKRLPKCMRRSLWRNGRIAFSGVVLGLAACRPVKQVSALGKQIGQEFHRPILVSAGQRNQLILVIPAILRDSSGDSAAADSTDPATLARQVAQYAVKHYERASSLKNVTVMFDGNDQMAKYTWTADDLSGRTGKPGTPGTKSD
jgi:hypothetical protein